MPLTSGTSGAPLGPRGLALILAPAFASRHYFAMAGPAVIGEGALCLWLLVKGVNAASWEELNHRRVSADTRTKEDWNEPSR
jgi:hypothetical protein